MNDLRTIDRFELEPVDDLFQGLMRPWASRLQERAPRIKIDLSETDKQYLIKADVPGVRKEDIDVRIDGNQVTISAEIKQGSEDKQDGRVLRTERHVGYASRSFALASDVDDQEAVAKYKDGVLELALPKKTRSSSKRLQIG